MGIWLLVGFRHLTEFFFEVSDLVAQTGREFELELFGGGVHLFAQLANQVGEVLRGQAGLQDLLVAFVCLDTRGVWVEREMVASSCDGLVESRQLDVNDFLQ